MNMRLVPEIWVGVAVLAFAAIVFQQSTAIPVSPLYARVGPTFVPYATAFALGILGVFLLIAGLRGGWSDDDPEIALPVDWRSFRWLLLGLALNVALIDQLGFIIASCLLFVCTARCFGSRKPHVDLGLGFVLATVAFVGFAKGLGINIGSGPIEALF
jgi:putative tricarboxylic transport membrane protein